MPTPREQALLALVDRLRGLAGPTALRNEAVPSVVAAGGLIIVRDGEAGEPEINLSPLTYHWQHRAEVEVIGADASVAARDAALDTLLAAIAAALAADRTLGGAVEWCVADVPRFDTAPVEGGVALKGAVVPVLLLFQTADPLA